MSRQNIKRSRPIRHLAVVIILFGFTTHPGLAGKPELPEAKAEVAQLNIEHLNEVPHWKQHNFDYEVVDPIKDTRLKAWRIESARQAEEVKKAEEARLEQEAAQQAQRAAEAEQARQAAVAQQAKANWQQRSYAPVPTYSTSYSSGQGSTGGLTGSRGYALAGGNCVNEPGVNNPFDGTNPISWAVTSYQPWIGATALFTYNHVGVVTGIWSNGDLEIRHQNFTGGITRFPRSQFRGFR